MATEPGDRSSLPRTISVALCTYNGARFLQRQLQSMLRQSRLPDELVVFDDCSQDATPAILEQFAARAPFPVRVHRNAENYGSTRTFERAIQACRGEFIALSDQDDVWRPHRLARSVAELDTHPEAGLVFGDAEIIDDEDHQIGLRLWENYGFHRPLQERLASGDFIPMARRRFVTGATVMFRAKYLEHCFPVGKRWVHDGWIAAIIASLSGLRMIDEPLIDYRMHSAQQIGLGPSRPSVKPRNTRELRIWRHWTSFLSVIDDLDELCAALDRLPLTAGQRAHGPARGFYTERDFLVMRYSLPEDHWRRIPIVWKARESYRECAMGWLSMLKDVRMGKRGDYRTMPEPDSNNSPSRGRHHGNHEKD